VDVENEMFNVPYYYISSKKFSSYFLSIAKEGMYIRQCWWLAGRYLQSADPYSFKHFTKCKTIFVNFSVLPLSVRSICWNIMCYWHCFSYMIRN